MLHQSQNLWSGPLFSGGRDFFLQMSNSVEYYIHKEILKGSSEICSFLKVMVI